MTIDEAIRHCEEVAGEQQERADSAELIDILDGLDVEACEQCAADHRQLAEWLTELKNLREENKDWKEAYAYINKLSYDYYKELKEAKRLLKSAIDEWHIVCEWGNCGEYCGWYVNGQCSQKWSGEAEALKLIGGEPNGI